MVQNKTFSAKALQTFVAVMFAVITCFGFMTTPTAEAASGFYVSGTSIYDASGNKFVMRGVNIAHAWYTEKTETSIKGAANNGANTVRVVLANGSKYTKTSAQEVSMAGKSCAVRLPSKIPMKLSRMTARSMSSRLKAAQSI